MLTPFRLALKSLKRSPARTALSLTGIVIGIVAVILVLSLGAGVKKYILDEVESFGSDIIQVENKILGSAQFSQGNSSGATVATSFKLEEADELSENDNVVAWYAGLMGQEVISYLNNDRQAMIFATTNGIEEVDANFSVVKGRMYSEQEDKEHKQVVLLGSKIKEELFGLSEAVGEKVKIKGRDYSVLGVSKERGSSGFFDWDELIYLPVSTFQNKVENTESIDFAIYKLKDMSQEKMTILEMENQLREKHSIDDPKDDDFAVNSITEVTEIAGKIFNIVDILLLAMTSISLIVGGVGITNVMYVSVTERTFEIGLRKAMGAKKGDILRQFILEAVFLTFLGGILGLLFGFGLAKLIEYVVAQLGYILYFPVTLKAVVIALGFSVSVGLIFGIRPAMSAAKLNPMEALRK